MLGIAFLLGAGAVFTGVANALTPPGKQLPQTTPLYTPPAQTDVQKGRQLFIEGCSDCHGLGAQGTKVAPSLHGVGAEAADFYLRTGRMPLADPGQEPLRGRPAYSSDQIAALDAYVGSLGGPPIPKVDPAKGDLSTGFKLWGEFCMGCHQGVAQGGVMTGAFPPPLQSTTPTQVAEAIRTGPFLMPNFSEQQISDQQVNDIARYVLYMQHPVTGGWAIGNIGPIPEGMITWLLAIPALLIAIRVIGERTTE
jgi:ubiquinol-cytochrome c reductase cytochrome c subunit